MRPYLCVPLRGARGGVALISERWWPLVDGYHWYQTKSGYAISPKVGFMHRRLVAAESGPLGEHVDHKNFNRLDNRHENLRCCTPQANQIRSRKRNTPWPYKGVRFYAPKKSSRFKVGHPAGYSGKWYARIKAMHIGSFDTAEEAALAYDAAARRLFGHNAVCNFGDAQ